MECRVCHRPIDEKDLFRSRAYWGSGQERYIQMGGETILMHPDYDYHKECYKLEAYECQKIDADCNDCKYFERIRNNHIPNTSIKWGEGNCKKLNKPATAHVNYCSNHDCFEHRRD